MIVQGQILSISNAPALQKRVRELESLSTGLKWQVDQLTQANLTLKEQLNHYKAMILLEGKERKKLIRQRKRSKGAEANPR